MTDDVKNVELEEGELSDLREAEDILQRIELQEEDCGKLALQVEDATEILKSKKASYQAAVLQLRDLCRLRKEENPLFDPQPPAASDGWRAYYLTHLGISDALTAKLTEADLPTLGALSDRMADKGSWWHDDIKGVGKKAAEEIEDRFEDFWLQHPEFCQQESTLDLNASWQETDG